MVCSIWLCSDSLKSTLSSQGRRPSFVGRTWGLGQLEFASPKPPPPQNKRACVLCTPAKKKKNLATTKKRRRQNNDFEPSRPTTLRATSTPLAQNSRVLHRWAKRTCVSHHLRTFSLFTPCAPSIGIPEARSTCVNWFHTWDISDQIRSDHIGQIKMLVSSDRSDPCFIAHIKIPISSHISHPHFVAQIKSPFHRTDQIPVSLDKLDQIGQIKSDHIEQIRSDHITSDTSDPRFIGPIRSYQIGQVRSPFHRTYQIISDRLYPRFIAQIRSPFHWTYILDQIGQTRSPCHRKYQIKINIVHIRSPFYWTYWIRSDRSDPRFIE